MFTPRTKTRCQQHPIWFNSSIRNQLHKVQTLRKQQRRNPSQQKLSHLQSAESLLQTEISNSRVCSHRTRLLPIYTMFTSILSSKGMEISLHHSYTKIKRDILCHPISTYLSSQLSLQSSRKFVFDKFNVFILENYITDHQFGFLL